MIHLTLEQILELHVLVIEETGGSDGLRDLGRLEAVVASQTQAVFGEELYKTIFDKAGVICRNIIGDHPFTDGNKRTGMLCALTLLEVNNCSFRAKKGELEDFAVQIAVEHLSVHDIADWYKKHTQIE